MINTKAESLVKMTHPIAPRVADSKPETEMKKLMPAESIKDNNAYL
jgi:hypothetical protein